MARPAHRIDVDAGHSAREADGVNAASARVADGVIEHLALSEAELAESNASLAEDVQSYRELAVEAIHALADLRLKHQRLQDNHYRLIDEYRELRAAVMRADGANEADG